MRPWAMIIIGWTSAKSVVLRLFIDVRLYSTKWINMRNSIVDWLNSVSNIALHAECRSLFPSSKVVSLSTTCVVWLMSWAMVIIFNTTKVIGWTSSNIIVLRLSIAVKLCSTKLIVLITSIIVRLISVSIIALHVECRSLCPPSKVVRLKTT